MVLHVSAEDRGSGGQSGFALRQPSHDHGEDAPATHMRRNEEKTEANFRRTIHHEMNTLRERDK